MKILACQPHNKQLIETGPTIAAPRPGSQMGATIPTRSVEAMGSEASALEEVCAYRTPGFGGRSPAIFGLRKADGGNRNMKVSA